MSTGDGVKAAVEAHEASNEIVTTSNLYMIDLAGSEAFDYAEESIRGIGIAKNRGINAGLVALGRVLMAMSDKAAHVPYRCIIYLPSLHTALLTRTHLTHPVAAHVVLQG